MVALIVNLLVLVLSIVSGLYAIVVFSIIITLSIIAPFFDIPSLKKSGQLIYYSDLFIAEKEKNGIVIIHGGSLFDYVFAIDRNLNGKQRTDFILQKFVEGFLNLIDEYETSENTSVKVKGTTYFINEITAKKMGLSIVKTDFIQKLILMYNYVNVLLSNSIAKRKLSFPNLNNIKTFETEITTLIGHKEFISKLNDKLNNASANNV